MIIFLMGFIFFYFDNSVRSITLADVVQLKVTAQKLTVDSVKSYAIGYLAKADFGKLATEAKLIFLRPSVLQSDFKPRELIPATIEEF